MHDREQSRSPLPGKCFHSAHPYIFRESRNKIVSLVGEDTAITTADLVQRFVRI